MEYVVTEDWKGAGRAIPNPLPVYTHLTSPTVCCCSLACIDAPGGLVSRGIGLLRRSGDTVNH